MGDWRLQDQNGSITPNTPITLLNKSAEWYRPQSWLPMPEMAGLTRDIVAGLLAIFKGASGATGASADSNFIALSATGNYIVDWGITTAARPNGFTTAHTSSTTAQFQYNWNDVPASTETPYGYRQVMVRITAQPGATLTTINLNQRYSDSVITLSQFHQNAWLSVKARVPNVTSFSFGNSNPSARQDWCEELEFVGRSAIQSFADLTQNMVNLQCIRGTEWSAVASSCNSAHAQTWSLRRYPHLDTRNFNNNVHGMFGTCFNLEVIPPLFWDGVTSSSIMSTSSIFSGTSVIVPPSFSMRRVQIPTTSITNGAGAMFSGCSRLKRVNSLDLSQVRIANDVFNSNYCLVKLPDTITNTQQVTANGMFSNCWALRKFPTGMCFANVNNSNQMFRDMYRMTEFPTAVIGSGLTSSGLTADLLAFQSNGLVAPRLNWSKITTVVSAYRLSTFPEIVGGVITGGWGTGATFGWSSLSIFNSAFTMRVVPKFEGLMQSIDLRDTVLSPTELDNFFTALGTTTVGVTTGTLNVSGNPGLTGGGRTPGGASLGIAINKGWTFTNA